MSMEKNIKQWSELLPSHASVSELLEMLGGVSITVAGGEALDLAHGSPVVLASYEDKSEAFNAFCICDVGFANSAGSMLTQIPSSQANDSIRKGVVSESALENLKEVFNIAISLFAQPVKLKEVKIVTRPIPTELAAMLKKADAQLDLNVTITGYSSGILSFYIAEIVKEPEVIAPAPSPPEAAPPANEELPTKKKPAGQSSFTAANSAGTKSTKPSTSKNTPADILLIDDMDNVAKKFQALLPNQMIFHSCVNPQTAFSLCKKYSFQLIIVDTVIPAVDTKAMITEIKKLQPESTLLALITRNLDGPSTVKEFGLTGWVYKPFDAKQVGELLAQFTSPETLKVYELRANLLRVFPPPPRPELEVVYFKQLQTGLIEGIDAAASACYDEIVLDLSNAPLSLQLQETLTKTKEHSDEMGVTLQIVGSNQIHEFLQESPSTTPLEDNNTDSGSQNSLMSTAAMPATSTTRSSATGYSTSLYRGPLTPAYQATGSGGVLKPVMAKAGPSPVASSNQVADTLRGILLKRIENNTLVLPTLPQTALQVQELLTGDTPDLKKIGKILQQDPVLSLQILQLANSSMYGGIRKFEDISQAVLHLGLKNVQQVLYAATAYKMFTTRNKRISIVLKKIWDHCVAVAFLSRRITRHLNILADESAFLAGLLHDIGKPIVITHLLDAEEHAKKQGKGQWLTETQWLAIVEDINRPVSIAIVDKWQVPETVVEAVHNCVDYNTDNPTCLSNIVCLANNLAKKLGIYIDYFDMDKAQKMVSDGQPLLNLDNEALEVLSEDLELPVGM